MPERPDLSSFLIHFTKPANGLSALDVLLKIVKEKRLMGSNKLIKSKDSCVCFTETPIEAIKNGVYDRYGKKRYSRFGILMTKADVFRLDGRPVIYQTDAEFALLRPENAWRHMHYDLSIPLPIDFTWEREWRIRTNHVDLSNQKFEVIVPDTAAEREFISAQSDSYYEAWSWSTVLGDAAWAYDEPLPWKTIRPMTK